MLAALSLPLPSLPPGRFFSNWFSAGGEAKSTGKISLPVPGTGPRTTMIDPADVGTAAAAILQLPAPALAPFLAARRIEVKGASCVNFEDVAAALSKAVGYSIALQPVPGEAFVGVLMGFGIPRVFATSFLETYQQCDGIVPAGYEGYGAALFEGFARHTSPELLAIGWKAKTVEEWAYAPATKAVFGKQ